MIKTVIKRDGSKKEFDREKIYNAIMLAMKNGSGIVNEGVARHISNSSEFHFDDEVTILDIEDYVFDELIRLGEILTSRHYIEYKAVRTSIRKYRNKVFDQMQDVMDLTSEDIRDNANKSGDKLGSLRAMFSDIACKEFVKERITPPHLEKEQERLIYEHDRNYRNIPFYNCFSGDTEFITNYGVMKFNDCFDNQEVEVLDKKGKWRNATVRKYAKQDLYKITLQSGRTVKEIKATKNHRWLLKDGNITTNIEVGDRLYLLNETQIDELNDEMYCLGFILGDGHDYFVNNKKTEGTKVRLCGEKISHLNKFIKAGYKVSKFRFENDDVEVCKNGFAFKNLFIENRMWKILSKKDKISLFMGYYSADGSKDTNGIATSNKNLAQMIREISALAGYHIASERHVIRSTNYKDNAELYIFRFMKSQPSNRNWIVKNIEKYNSQKYDVWCVEEPITKTFTLNGGIVTGNCTLVNYSDMLMNGFKVGTTEIKNINSITTAVAILSQIVAHVSSGCYGGITLQRLDERLEPYIVKSYNKHLQIAIDESIPDKEGYAWRRLEKEVHDACQAFEYEVQTLTNTRGEVPFLTISFGLGTSKYAQLFQTSYLKVREEGLTGGVTAVFPKIVFITKKGVNREGDPQYYLYKQAIRTSCKRIYPDYMSYEKITEITGDFKTSMGL